MCLDLVKYNININICTTYYDSLAVSLSDCYCDQIHFSPFTLQFSFQEKNCSNLSQELKTAQCSSISKKIPDSSKFTRKEDFFIFTEADPR